MVVHRVLGDRDLITEADRDSDPLVYGNATNQDSRREEHLGFPLTLAIRPPGIIDFEFRPEIVEDPILQGGVPGDRHTKALKTAIRQCDTRGALNIECAKAFATGNCRVEIPCRLLLPSSPVGALKPMNAVRM